jgi:hypothetical protein
VRIFSVLIHGAFNSHLQVQPGAPFARGFYTTRWVLAADEKTAVQEAFRSAEEELNSWSNVRDGLVSVSMEAEEIGPGSLWRWLRGGGRGFAFYTED